jgi:hypothetical protein
VTNTDTTATPPSTSPDTAVVQDVVWLDPDNPVAPSADVIVIPSATANVGDAVPVPTNVPSSGTQVL